METATARDPFLWVPEDLPHPRGYYVSKGDEEVVRVHSCPLAAIVARVTREMLDPMALGRCRYCKEPLDADL